ncbi:hypothetical protein [Tropicimonas sp. IMCC6043]|uniref:hypothetical protein n=1 Tax=Tropicimonas sp. IMCC6043 TaxID=2510645 RepID=UPI00352EC03D
MEALRPRDLVLTRDDGALPLRWIGRRQVIGQGNTTLALIETDVLGNSRPPRADARSMIDETPLDPPDLPDTATEMISTRPILTVREGAVLAAEALSREAGSERRDHAT